MRLKKYEATTVNNHSIWFRGRPQWFAKKQNKMWEKNTINSVFSELTNLHKEPYVYKTSWVRLKKYEATTVNNHSIWFRGRPQWFAKKQDKMWENKTQ